MANEPSHYEKDTRLMLVTFTKDVKESLKTIELKVTNHLAHRLPVWATIVMSILTGTLGVLIATILR